MNLKSLAIAIDKPRLEKMLFPLCVMGYTHDAVIHNNTIPISAAIEGGVLTVAVALAFKQKIGKVTKRLGSQRRQ